MQTLEQPTILDWPVFHNAQDPFGQFVIISFDPVASVAPLEDASTTEAAAALPRKKWLALAATSGILRRLDANGKMKLAIQFYLLGEGLPDDGTMEFVIPVDPCTAHPLNRVPIAPSKSLPWNNCYVYSLQNCYTVVSRIHYDPAKPCPHLPHDQQEDVFIRIFEDMYEMNVRQAASFKAPVEAVHNSNQMDLNAPIGDVTAEYSTDSSTSEGKESDDGLADVYQKIAAVATHVEIWTDLSVCTDPRDLAKPRDFLPSTKVLHELNLEYERRMLAQMTAKPHTSTWVDAIANTSFDDIAQQVDNDIHDNDTSSMIAEEVDLKANSEHVSSRVSLENNGEKAVLTSGVPSTLLGGMEDPGNVQNAVGISREAGTALEDNSPPPLTARVAHDQVANSGPKLELPGVLQTTHVPLHKRVFARIKGRVVAVRGRISDRIKAAVSRLYRKDVVA